MWDLYLEIKLHIVSDDDKADIVVVKKFFTVRQMACERALISKHS